jgi:ATP-dependent protease ClpP protease subunit
MDFKMAAKDYDTINIRFCSPGGSVTASLNLYDYLMSLRMKGVNLNTYATGMCASGATVALQADKMRYVSPTCLFMVHKARIYDKNWLKERWLNWSNREDLQNCDDRLIAIYSMRSGRPLGSVDLDLKDVWIDALEVIEKGYADQISY